ncbi:hypothetical protein BDZ94DRAFT_1154403 [Collybia nuda]|uniref:Histone-lysine N-methyltransferase, H3 lysine-36 specific n=1 Tax=Collybia nuda TaxID=64659 RepID=A0A9P5YG47_9AGAR|nr:hypothetical protein BDZ94DRAFT_1154403 [Collybia nuda]
MVNDSELKTEPHASPSESPTLRGNDMSPQKPKLSPTPTPPPATASGTSSMTPTPPPPPSATTSKKGQASSPQLIGDLPIARDEALATFTEIPENNYQYKTLGRSREALESMTCDCSYEHGVDNTDAACGPYSDCINRLTQVECLPDDCRCRAHCQNQRFQRLQYANIDIVQTEKKGFGLRAENDLSKDTFIYEYVGDVVNPISFKKRMRDYAAEGIQHFYFMMLQKDEFIDATKNGGIGRFANHSCKPNCYVAKWTIGNYVRMGIFAKRDIQQYEELTFNYNVDRYGHQAQVCYCGESNCVGFIGGKTQTDIATMDDLYLDALGITDEADLLELKGSKKKKGKKIDDPDFMPTMKPIVEKDVPKVVQAIRQTQSRKVLYKLLTRIKITDDQAALRQIMRLRGYSLMTNLLEDYSSDVELITLALQCMSTWPLLNRNKVEDSKVLIPVQACAELDHPTLKDLAQSLLDHWQTLPLYNRIPKRIKHDDEGNDVPYVSTNWRDEEEEERERFAKRHKIYVLEEHDLRIVPRGIDLSNPRTMARSRPKQFHVYVPSGPSEDASKNSKYSRENIQAVIAAAAEKAAAEEAAAVEAAAAAVAKEAEAAAALAEAKANRALKKKSKPPKKTQTPEEREANKEKRLLKLVGAVVVKCMSKHSNSMDHDQFKKHAKEIIADKEKKSSSYKEGKLDSLSDEKVVKIKKFAKEYIAKVLRKLEKSGKRLRPPPSATTQATASTSTNTPSSTDGVDVVMGEMTVEEAMDMDSDSDPESDAEAEMGATVNGATNEPIAQSASPKSSPPEPPTPSDPIVTHPMEVDDQANTSSPIADPRRRPPADSKQFGWEPHAQSNGVSTTS